MRDESDSHARGSLLYLLRWLLQGAQRIVCPPRVFVPSGVWDVMPSSLRLWHLLRILALLLRARCAHLDLQVLRLALVSLRVSFRVFPLPSILYFSRFAVTEQSSFDVPQDLGSGVLV